MNIKRMLLFPKYLLLFFYILFVSFVILFSFSLYMLHIKSSNSLVLNKTEIVGDYVISPIDIESSHDDGSVGLVPSSSNSFIFDAEKIVKDLNAINGVKAIAVASKNIKHLIAVNAKKEDIDDSLYNRVNYNKIEQYFDDSEIKYSSVHSLSPGDFSGNVLYGVNSDSLASYFEGEKSYEFYNLTNRKGIFLSEKVAQDLELNERDESVLLFVSENRGSTFLGSVIDVPIAGFFRIPQKDYSFSESDWKDPLSYIPETKLIFIDIEFYRELFSATIYTEYSYDQASESTDISKIIADIRTLPSFSVIPADYQNIWVRSKDINRFKATLLKHNKNLAIDDTFSASISVSRIPEIVKTISTYGIILCALSSIMLVCGGFFLLARILNYQNEVVSLLYNQGCKRNRIFCSLYIPFTVPALIIYCVTIFCSLSAMSKEYTGYLHVAPKQVILSSLYFIILEFVLFIISSSFATWLFIKENTVEKMDLEVK